MSAFQPIDTKLDASLAPTFLTLDEPAFRSFHDPTAPSACASAAGGADDNVLALPFASALTATPDVFRSVGAEASVGGSLAIPAFGITSAASRSVPQFADRYDSGSDDNTVEDGSASAAAAFWSVPASSSLSSSSAAGPSAIHSLKSLSLPAVVSAAVDVEEAPIYYERHSSFLTTAPPTDVLLAVAQLLEQQLIEFTYTPNKHKIRGVVLANAASSGAPAHFIVRVWRSSAAQAFLVEFQRRSGCVVVFTNFYRAVTASLAHLIMGAAKPKAAINFDSVLRATEPLPLSSSSSSSSGVTLDEQSYAALSEMASSRDAVCASEAMRVLGRAVATSPANQEFVAARLSAAPLATSSSDAQAAAAVAKAVPVSTSLASAVRSSNSYLQLLAVKLITTLCAASATASSDSAALLKLLPSPSMQTPASDLLSRETARLVKSVRGASRSGSTASAGVTAHNTLALPSLLSAATGKHLTVRPAFASVDADLDAHNAAAFAEGF